MKETNFRRTKLSCYYSYLSMASVFALPPLLFITFREMYGISYTLLGTLILINFCTQLAIDLIFTFFTRYFNIKKTVRIMPVLTTLGMLIYAIIPLMFKEYAYIGLVLGTVLFSVSAGFSEVLLSPIVAAIPSDNPDRDMSMLHSLYAWGVVTVVAVSTIFLKMFGSHNWMYLTMFLSAFPLVACFMFCTSPMPDVDISQNQGSKSNKKRTIGMGLCVGCIFLGSAAENVMTNWISGYMENALNISKSIGDIFGMALFAVLLGCVRTLYAKYGRNISNVLLFGMLGAVICYVTAGLCRNTIVGMIACVATGICTSMLWPGTLIYMEEKITGPGVAAYALMAAGGDFGASIAPQMMGIIVDNVSVSQWALEISKTVSLTAEQIGMKVGMLIAAIFPIMGVLLILVMKKYFAKES